jgi:hypothetical protein
VPADRRCCQAQSTGSDFGLHDDVKKLEADAQKQLEEDLAEQQARTAS